ncbi:MAG: hypothetical protein OXP07_17430 [Defluviicoccus sp.]|nr:hypothetical protein [Defluviicoccus sp.]
MRGVVTIREHQKFENKSELTRQDAVDLEWVARKVLKRKDGDLAASNFVGVVTTRRGLVLEILPKIDLGGEADPDDETTRQTFLRMLRSWRGLGEALPQSGIRAMSRFPMLDVFVRQFLIDVSTLSRAGLARRYVPVEENLPYLRGRLLIREQLRENLADGARFVVAHDELSVNRPANRLIRSTLARLAPGIRSEENRLLLRRLEAAFENVPESADVRADWERHHVDRSMHLYAPVMQWVGLFLFNRGLTTFAGQHANVSLLFPMEKVFENFVTHSFGRHQRHYRVAAQHPQEKLATIDGKGVFTTKPDIALKEGKGVRFILDAKWKGIDASSEDGKHGIDQDDMYQLHAYGKLYGCEAVALVYPRTGRFESELRYRFFDGLPLVCLPFDVTQPEKSVGQCLQVLGRERLKA